LNYKNWLLGNTDRAWRKSISETTLSAREFYPTEGAADPNENFVLPALVTAFEFTIPESTFGGQAGDFLVGFFKTRAHYCFSQRRTDINQLVGRAKTNMKNSLIANAKSGVLGALGVAEGEDQVIEKMAKLSIEDKTPSVG
jgi:hypothetical protein